MRRRFRFAVVGASVAAAIAGSVLLAEHRLGENAGAPSAALPPGGKVMAQIRVGGGQGTVGEPLAVGAGAVWAISDAGARLMRIDPARNAIAARIKVGVPAAVAAAEGGVWLSNQSYNTVTRIDPATNTRTTIRVGPSPEGIAVSPGAVWVANAGRANAGGPSVSRIDPATNRVVATIPVGPKSDSGAEYTNLVASPRAVWVALPNGDSIVRIDPATNRVVKTVQVGFQPCGFLAADATDVWVTPAGCGGGNAPSTVTNLVARVDSRTNKVTRLADAAPAGIVAAFGTVWVATGAGNVDQIGPHSGRLVARLHIGGGPGQLGVGFGSIWLDHASGGVVRIKPQH
jgi:YVTN family beta-propeller protein